MSFLLYSGLLFRFSAPAPPLSLSLCFILLLVFTPVVILVPSPFLSSSQGLLVTLQQHQAPDIEMSRPSVSQTDIEKGEKDIKRHSRARGSDNKGGRRMSEAKGTRDSCCRLEPSDELKPLWFLAACTLHEAAPSVCGGKKKKNLNKKTRRSIKGTKSLSMQEKKGTLHLRNDLTVMARYHFDPPTHALLSHIHTFILTIGPHSCETT